LRESWTVTSSVLHNRNILIVEDTKMWAGVLERAARATAATSVWTAASYAEAVDAIARLSFAAALIDVNLDEDDDQNVDGLRVMKDLRSSGDATKIIMVTGREGRDIVSISRTALKEFEAFDAVAKGQVGPAELMTLVEAALLAHSEDWARRRPAVHDFLRGSRESWEWDHEMLQKVTIRGGVSILYKFLDDLFGAFVPAVATSPGRGCELDPTRGVVSGLFWSRAAGKPILIYFGRVETMANVELIAEETGHLADTELGAVLTSVSGPGIRGVVREAANIGRESFSG
jgi:CheY-like chemotaxis protein